MSSGSRSAVHAVHDADVDADAELSVQVSSDRTVLIYRVTALVLGSLWKTHKNIIFPCLALVAALKSSCVDSRTPPVPDDDESHGDRCRPR